MICNTMIISHEHHTSTMFHDFFLSLPLFAYMYAINQPSICIHNVYYIYTG